jgi:error-prone DNA polymerase
MPEHPNIKLRHLPDAPKAAGPSDLPYAELDVTTNFSFLRGASHPDEMVFRAAELGYRAIAVTDRNSLAGVVRAHDAIRLVKEQGGVPPKLILGARLTFDDGPDVLVWPTDRPAYARLCRLLTQGKRRAEKGQCLLHLEDLLESHQGLLAAVMGDAPSITGVPPVRTMLGVERLTPRDFNHNQHGPDARDTESPLRLHKSPHSLLREAFGPRLSLAATALYGPDDHSSLAALAQLSKTFDIPLLATNHVHYHDPSRRQLQDVLVCIRHACTIQEAGYRLFPNGERYLKTPAQIHRLFAEHPKAIQRSLDIADQCHFSLDHLKYEYPDELVPEAMKPIEYLRKLAYQGALERHCIDVGSASADGTSARETSAEADPTLIPEKVRALLDHELSLIEQLHFEAYFLTVHDLVKFARSRGILCQGRGSAANSAVCYCLGVTSVDPTKVDLLFERFVSAARNEPPDIDIDFEHERREEVIQYLYEKYGRDRAGMTAEVISYRGRSAVRDVGKALGLSLDLVDQLAKKLDWWHQGTLAPEMMRQLGLDPRDPTMRKVIDLTGQILGFPRHLSQHVGGMVMTRGPLCEMVPIENATMPGRTMIEWDKDDIDTVGILKVDALGLGMLTVISKAFQLVNNAESPPLQLHTIPSEDPAVYAMISDADTIGVFQIESRAQMTMLPRLRPKNFYDLVIEVAIVRPGPIQGDMVHPYLRRRNGEEPVSYPSQALREVLEKTLGVPLFQEQAMRVAMVGAGFSAAEADQLRRAMAAWRKNGAIERFHDKIISGMLDNGYTAEFAEQCFNQIRGFGEYGFPESHAASFALLVYVSAWLKRYHPAPFAAALLNSQPMGFYAPAQIVRDAKDHGVQVLPIDVNHSDWDCTLEDSDQATERPSDEGGASPFLKSEWGKSGPAMRLGFRLIKGLHESHGKKIPEIRRQSGPFTSIAHFHRATALPTHALRRLAEADAFSSLNLSRRQALWQTLELKDNDHHLFDPPSSILHPPSSSPPAPHLPPMPLGQEVMTDYATTTLSLKKHPVALIRPHLDKLRITKAADILHTDDGTWVKVAGLVLIRQRPGTASGVVFETLEDETGIVNLIVWPQTFEKYRPAARHAGLLQCDGYVQRQGQVIHILAKRLIDLSHLLKGYQLTSRDFH